MGGFASVIVIIFAITALAGAVMVMTQGRIDRTYIGIILLLASVGIIFITMGAYIVAAVQLILFTPLVLLMTRCASRSFPRSVKQASQIKLTDRSSVIVIGILFLVFTLAIARLKMTGLLDIAVPEVSGDLASVLSRFMDEWIAIPGMAIMLILLGLVGSAIAENNNTRAGDGDGSC